MQAGLWFAAVLGTGIRGFEAMPFNSSLLVFLFAPVVIPLGACLPVRFATAFILFASVLFMVWGEPKFVFVVLIFALLDYVIAREIHRARGEKKLRLLLAVGIALNLGLLAYCKYFGWFLQNLGALLADLKIASAGMLFHCPWESPSSRSKRYPISLTSIVAAHRQPAHSGLSVFRVLFPEKPILKCHGIR